jgi:hypothetical protein
MHVYHFVTVTIEDDNHFVVSRLAEQPVICYRNTCVSVGVIPLLLVSTYHRMKIKVFR